MKPVDLKKRTKEFAHRCAKLCAALPKNHLGDHIKKQLIRCCISVAANYRAACIAQSKAGFVSKLSIVIEEIDESFFWMEFIVDEVLLNKKKMSALLAEAGELTAIFVVVRKTAGPRKQNNQ